MSYLAANLWTGDEHPSFIKPLDPSNIKIMWEIPGGVHAVELDSEATSEGAYEFYDRYVGDRVVVHDHYFDRPVAEGWVYGIAIAPFGNRILCRGPWYRHFDQYNRHSAKMTDTTTEILKGTLNYVPVLSDLSAYLEDTEFQIDPAPGYGPETLFNPGFEAAGGKTNLINNGTFAVLGDINTFQFWVDRPGDGQIIANTDVPYSGQHCVQLVAGEEPSTHVAQGVHVSPHDFMLLEFYAAGDGKHTGRYMVYDTSNNNVIEFAYNDVSGSEWQKVQAWITVPSDCSQIEIRFYCPEEEGAYAFVDAVEFFTLDLEIAEWNEHPGDGNVVHEEEIVRSGERALRLEAGPEADTLVRQPVYVVEGEEMKLSFYARGDGSFSPDYRVINANTYEDIISRTTTGVTQEEYTEVADTFVVPDGCEFVLIDLMCPGAGQGMGWIDDASLRNTTVYWRASEGEMYPADMITKLCVMSDDDLRQWNYWVESAAFQGTMPGKPIPHFAPQEDTRSCDWQVWRSDLGRAALTMERNIEDLANKVLVIYRDIAGNEQRIVDWASRAESQDKFWTREIIKSGGRMVRGAAEQYRDLTLKKFSEPMLRKSFTITAPMIMDAAGAEHPLWRVVAEGGGYLRFNDLYPAPESLAASWDRRRVGQIMMAEYDDEQYSLRIVLDTEDDRLDHLLARIGIY